MYKRPSNSTVRVYLIPGFFGFANLGEVKYFSHVKEHLAKVLSDAGQKAKIHYVPTLPTASLPRRAKRLAETIRSTVRPGDEIHLVGHSSGGLDARLLIHPNAALTHCGDLASLVSQIGSIVTVACPHHGTPLASFFTSLLGQRLLKLLSTVTLQAIRFGSAPFPVLVALTEAFAASLSSSGMLPGVRARILDNAYERSLRVFDNDRRERIAEFFEQVKEDQSLMVQITPEGMALFNAVAHRESIIRCGSIVTTAPKPNLKRNLRLGLKPNSHAMYTVYRALHKMTVAKDSAWAPSMESAQREALMNGFGLMPSSSDNDGIVPTLSQVFGEVIHTAIADHLDVVGHFSDSSSEPPHVDWLCTATGFKRSRFEDLWNRVVTFILTR